MPRSLPTVQPAAHTVDHVVADRVDVRAPPAVNRVVVVVDDRRGFLAQCVIESLTGVHTRDARLLDVALLDELCRRDRGVASRFVG
jgi:hypothetical protein